MGLRRHFPRTPRARAVAAAPTQVPGTFHLPQDVKVARELLIVAEAP